ncbi:MAG TPA: helix-turn-helix domain-containing protein [Candidatus Dormibacteraeota bacterium]|nr:helix-turn-helix domain-containing protein [Candidatus Dormibacteraeota bacterium]
MAETLGELIRRARNEKGWSLRRLGSAAEIHNAHLSQIENGGIARPATHILWGLATALSLDYERLLELAGHVIHDQAAPRRSLAGVALHALEDLTPEEQAEVLRFMEEVRGRRAATGE